MELYNENDSLNRKVIEQIKADFEMGDVTAIHELLDKLSVEDRESFLSEE